MSDTPQTKKVNIELEVDTTTVDSSKNRFQSWIDLASTIFLQLSRFRSTLYRRRLSYFA